MIHHIFCRPRRATGWRAAVGIEEGRRRASAGTSAARRCRAIVACEAEPSVRDGAVSRLTFAVGAARAPVAKERTRSPQVQHGNFLWRK